MPPTVSLSKYTTKTELESYKKKDDLMFPAKQSLEYIQESDKAISTEKFVNGAHIVGKYEGLLNIIGDFNFVFEANSELTENTYYSFQTSPYILFQ